MQEIVGRYFDGLLGALVFSESYVYRLLDEGRIEDRQARAMLALQFERTGSTSIPDVNIEDVPQWAIDELRAGKR